MKREKKSLRVAALSAGFVATALVACAPLPATKDVLADRTKFLNDNFTPAQLPAPVRAVADNGPAVRGRFKKAVVSYQIDRDEDGRSQSVRSTTTMVNLGNGYQQFQQELSKNDMPYRLNSSLTYAGLFSMRNQSVFTDQTNGQQLWEVKELNQLDRKVANPVSGQSYVFAGKGGLKPQLANYRSFKMICVAGDSQAANSIHAKLAGAALILKCETTGDNGVVASRTNYAWLSDYGFAVTLDSADSHSKSTYKVTDISIGS